MNLTFTGGRERLRPYQGLGVLLLVALLVRLAIAPYGGYQYDIEVFRSWAVQLTSAPPWGFYELQPPPDKLPADLWLLWASARCIACSRVTRSWAARGSPGW